MADLCSRIARTGEAGSLTPVLADAAAVLDAVGVIVWACDLSASALRAVASHGYAEIVLAQLPAVAPDDDNAIAMAFRSVEIRIVDGSDTATGAVVAPITTAAGCVGVLAVELRDRGERREFVAAALTILAAQLSPLLAPRLQLPAVPAEASSADAPPVQERRRSLRLALQL
jgi:hypothetical protein